ncbi:hypothetical protein AYJ57_20525 (plasmid) [Salipiger sp. CCB-MM3]|uniref:H-NS histone family protein n=1 Tax=Salipiger sp. CCB-MM3 TaxID=1792508 RepID=UPI00080AAD4A|nr:H-NS histone family protein [Salipiger sp. CCB-MM3]ANT62874.1 hypothetical protein AYJ57_20525 [Salipiger sp. CCB-MM3]
MYEQSDLVEMDKAELESLSKRVSKALEDYDNRQRAKAWAAAEASAKEFGFALSELMQNPGKKASKGAPKYAHPEQPSETWTGRGRKPKWVEAHLAAGGDLEELAIAA